MRAPQGSTCLIQEVTLKSLSVSVHGQATMVTSEFSLHGTDTRFLGECPMSGCPSEKSKKLMAELLQSLETDFCNAMFSTPSEKPEASAKGV